MRWLLAASLMAGLAAVPALAQRGMAASHMSGGLSAPRGFSAPHMSGGFTSGAHISTPTIPRSNFSTPPQYHWNVSSRYPANQFSRPSAGGLHSSSPDWHHGRPSYPVSRYRKPYRPYFYASSTYLVPGLLNSYWDSPDTSYSEDQYAPAQDQGQVDTNSGYESEPPPPVNEQAQDVPPPPPGPSEPLPQAAVTVIFKDGHSQQVHNYAMTKTTLYVLDDAASGRRPEIPIDQIDIAATEQANRGTGVDFVIPTKSN